MAEENEEGNIFKGGAKEFFEIIKPCAEKFGKSFCKYKSEAQRVTDSTLHVEDIKQHPMLLERLHAAQQNKCFTKNVVKEGLKLLLKSKIGKSWGISKEKDEGDYVETLQRRIRNMCRQVEHNERKRNPPKWVKELPWNKQESDDEKESEDGDVEEDKDKEEHGKQDEKETQGKKDKKEAFHHAFSKENEILGTKEDAVIDIGHGINRLASSQPKPYGA